MRHVIYVPGLGDRIPYGRKVITWFWRIFGLKVHYFPFYWADKEDYSPKFQRLLDKIDSFERVALVGESAGASAVLNAFAARPNLVGVVCISGKIQNAESISPRYFLKYPAFKDSVFKVQKSLAELDKDRRKKIMSIHPIYDQTVPIADTIIDGANEQLVHVYGHVQSIYYTIIFKPRLIAKFLNRQQSAASSNILD